MTTYKQLQQANGPVFTVMDDPSPVVLVIFTGKQPDLTHPGFNLGKGTAEWPVKKIYVRDLYNCWYHGRFPGIGGGIDDLAAYLRKQVVEAGCERVVAVGGSMGGYAAILLGCLIGADSVIAFGPQTFIDRGNRLRCLDFRSLRGKENVQYLTTANHDYFDLRRVVANAKSRPRIKVHVGRKDRIDRAHARHLWGFPEVSFVYHDTHRHDISRVLKQKGVLYSLLWKEVQQQKASLWDPVVEEEPHAGIPARRSRRVRYDRM